MTDQRPTADSLEDIAAYWAARLDARPLTPDEQIELDVWLASDSRCLGAFAVARAVLLGPSDTDTLLQPKFTRRQFGRNLVWAGGGAMAAGIGAAALLVPRGGRVTPRLFESVFGEIRKVPLDDGSHITLNTNSALSVEFSRSRRLIRMLRGEAYFEVARDADRPFIVQGALAQVRTIGTAYNVRLNEATAHEKASMNVQITSGRVAIEAPPSPLMRSLQSLTGGWPASSDDLSPLFLNANQEAVIGASDDGKMMVEVMSVADDTFTRVLAWRGGKLAFENETLAAAAAEFARYSPVRVHIANAELAQKHISGLFAVGDADGFARAAALSLGARMRQDDQNIVLY